MKNKKGFTLIELLICVLIIGVLAGVAIPKYQLSVDKSKFAGYQTMAKGMLDSSWRYYYANNKTPPSDIEALDINFPAGYTKYSPRSQSCVVFKDTYCCLDYPERNYQPGAVICGAKDMSIALHLYTTSDANEKYRLNRIECIAKTNNSRSMRVCKNMPYQSSYNANLPTYQGHKTGYTYYRLK